MAPVMTKPKSPGRRPLSRITPSKLRMNPSGVATITVNPPRVEMIDPQPGRQSSKTASATSGANEKHNPIRPKLGFGLGLSSAWIVGG